MPGRPSLRGLAPPGRLRASLTDSGGGLPLPLPSRRTWIAGLAVGLAALVVAAIAWQQSTAPRHAPADSLLGLVTAALRWGWVVGLWAAVLVLLLATAALLAFRESARLAERRLIHVVRLGPARVLEEYDLERVRNLRAVEAGGSARIRFDYGDRGRTLGGDMPPAEAEARVRMIQKAIDGLGARVSGQASAPGPRPTPRP